YNYITSNRFDDALFFRSAKTNGNLPFVLQGGGVTFDSTNHTFAVTSADPIVKNEPDAVNRSNVRGTLAMARGAAVNSANDQFYFNLGNNTNLNTDNGGFSVFGKVVAAADQQVLDNLAAVPTQNHTLSP